MSKKLNAKENTEKDAKQDKEENTDTDVEQEAWEFVDLVFTGKKCTPEQNINLDNLAKKLKNNKIAFQYIDLDIKNLIYSVAIGNDKKLIKIFNKCYDALETLETLNKLYPKHKQDLENDIEENLPPYLKKLKGYTDHEIKNLYKNVVTSYKWYYGIITNKGDWANVKERLDDMDRKIEDNRIKSENNIKKDIYPDFITILGIFTAITFAIFGGMNLLSSLFRNIGSTSASLGQTLILAAIFGLIMWGITILLFYWISTIKKDQYKKFYKNTGFWLNILFIVSIILLLKIGLCFFFKK